MEDLKWYEKGCLDSNESSDSDGLQLDYDNFSSNFGLGHDLQSYNESLHTSRQQNSSIDYLDASQQSDYLSSPQQKSHSDYLSNPQQQSQSDYLSTPQQQSQSDYLTNPQQSQSDYLSNPQQQSQSDYLPNPQQSQSGYWANSQQSQSDYLSNLQQSQNDYLSNPQQSQSDYLSNPQQSQNDYLSNPQQSQSDYLTNPQQSQSDYLSNPQQSQSDYLSTPQQSQCDYLSNLQQSQSNNMSYPQLSQIFTAICNNILDTTAVIDMIDSSKSNKVPKFNKKNEKELLRRNDPTQGANVHQDNIYLNPPNKKLKNSDQNNYNHNLVVSVPREKEKLRTEAVELLRSYDIEVNEHFNFPEQSWGNKEMNFSLEIPSTVNTIRASLKKVVGPEINSPIKIEIKYSGIGDWFIGCLTVKAYSGTYYLKIKYPDKTIIYPNIQFISNCEKCIPPSFYQLRYHNNKFYAFSSFLKAKPKKSDTSKRPPVVIYNENEIECEYGTTFGETPLFISFPVPNGLTNPENTPLSAFKFYYKSNNNK
ncbi:hypothetical protein DICPUDRAFT_80454 [Dictyostelium purpureum]|uniref:Uncharacterized protein n=1 Tax=Dictyostelium purpureum TaxID=5786 RepID=F0ZQI9_DICPU|nr:uncharacterized protein DICPUDRAFT_80454 [Dictyostelium purpureum]EGC33813.1 hypothetical protein DICPUDRAFT_80454 [Dictyostelium purpureum]|eukprot:XP_003289684.1 hypothetical protein DICPUDRAFT_80454 [Dictyostelium purpureum]